MQSRVTHGCEQHKFCCDTEVEHVPKDSEGFDEDRKAVEGKNSKVVNIASLVTVGSEEDLCIEHGRRTRFSELSLLP